MRGEFTVKLGQDPKLIFSQQHNKRLIEDRLIEEFGAQALKSCTQEHTTNPNNLFLETRATVVIMSVTEMQNLEKYIAYLELEVARLNRGGLK